VKQRTKLKSSIMPTCKKQTKQNKKHTKKTKTKQQQQQKTNN
jgi:hypothetical protein